MSIAPICIMCNHEEDFFENIGNLNYARKYFSNYKCSKCSNIKEIKEKNFILKKDYLGLGYIISFINSRGIESSYNHDRLYKLVSNRLENLPCWNKYGYYTNSKDIPVYMKNELENQTQF